VPQPESLNNRGRSVTIHDDKYITKVIRPALEHIDLLLNIAENVADFVSWKKKKYVLDIEVPQKLARIVGGVA